MSPVSPELRRHLAEIGRRGGLKSRREITAEQQEKMQASRRGGQGRKKAPVEDNPLGAALLRARMADVSQPEDAAQSPVSRTGA